jgi:hypothetical protein
MIFDVRSWKRGCEFHSAGSGSKASFSFLAASPGSPHSSLSPFPSLESLDPNHSNYFEFRMETIQVPDKDKRTTARICSLCNQRKAALKRPKTLEQVLGMEFSY